MITKKIIIAIDGFSSTGKSTIAKKLAAALGYVFVDTGAMYRAVTLHALQQGYIAENYFDQAALEASLSEIVLSFEFNIKRQMSDIHLNGENVEKQIRTLKVSKFVSIVAANSKVRKKLVEQQQAMGVKKGIVMDGRDIGTVVFPNADLKLYMIASPEVRAKRRYDELLERGDDVNYEDVFANVVERDRLDSTRKDSPLVKAKNAIEIDNSNMTLEEQFERLLLMANQIIEA